MEYGFANPSYAHIITTPHVVCGPARCSTMYAHNYITTSPPLGTAAGIFCLYTAHWFMGYAIMCYLLQIPALHCAFIMR